MFTELLDLPLFRAKSMATEWRDVLKIETTIGRKVPSEIVQEAQRRDFDCLPVVQGQEVLGYVRVEGLRDNILGRSMVQPRIDHEIPWSMSLPQLAARLSHDRLSPTKMYFVMENSSDVHGILTYADLNRRASYIYSYTLLAFLEQWIRGRITDEYETTDGTLGSTWLGTLSVGRRRTLRKWARTHRESVLSACELRDLLMVLKRDSRLVRYRSSVDARALTPSRRIRLE
jgi:hypothetical protein